jgi:hypothetical protein
MENLITQEGPLLKEDGSLFEAGYAKRLIKTYDRAAIKANQMRIKEWDYYLIYDQERAVCLTIADNSYMGLYSATIIDFTEPSEITNSVMSFMPMGKTHMPSSSRIGDVAHHDAKIDITFENDGETRNLYLNYPDFHEGKTLAASIQLTEAPQDTMVIMTPYQDDPKAFYYNQKINCMRASGYVTYGTDMYSFRKGTYGSLDWGRGVWTYQNTWYWSSASGEIGGHRFGFNLGYGFGDTSAASENMLFYDGIGHKLDRVEFRIPKDIDGKDDWMRPWNFTSNDGRFDAVFEPLLDRSALTNALVLKSDQNQVFGKFTGRAVLDDGTVLEMDHFLGFAEKVFNRW